MAAPGVPARPRRVGSEPDAFRESLRNLAYDVFHLEINTIIKVNMTAQKMPPTPHAILDIAADYVRFLCRFRAELEPDRQATLDGLGADRRTTAPETFDALKDLAVELHRRDATSRFLTGEDAVVVERIYRNAAQLGTIIRGIVRDDPDGEVWRATRSRLYALDGEIQATVLPPQARTIIRKMWDLGTERVVMQSVIELDGDVITRIQGDRSGSEDAVLHALHHEGVRVAIETWQRLVQTIGALVQGLAGFFGRVLRGPG